VLFQGRVAILGGGMTQLASGMRHAVGLGIEAVDVGSNRRLQGLGLDLPVV
jgi:hypothetical protein